MNARSDEEIPHQWVRSLFPDQIATVESPISDVQGSLYPEEAVIIEGAVDKRRDEFIAGRCCVRQAMTILGLSKCPIPSSPDRSPNWPDGVVGSIAHTDEYTGVALGLEEDVLSIGLDFEFLGRLGEHLWPSLFVEDELEWLRELSLEERNFWATLLFSAKECFYKFQYPLTRLFLGFDAVRVIVHPDRGQFEILLLTDVTREFQKDASFRGAYQSGMNTIFTGIYRLA